MQPSDPGAASDPTVALSEYGARVMRERAAGVRALLIAALLAVAYGLCARWFFGWFDIFGTPNSPTPPRSPEVRKVFEVMSTAFIFGVPFAMGFLASYAGRITHPGRAMLFAILPAMTSLVVALLLAWEGLICIALWLPLFLVLGALGGLAGAITLRVERARARAPIVGAVLVLPLAIAPLERAALQRDEVRKVATSVKIDADPAVVWREIASVPEIGPEEHTFAWSHLIGFPRPIAATLSGSGVGSVRHATFERGVLFIETVTLWRELEQLEFTIHSDPSSIPAKALDQHVTVGGPYFDVLNGAYAIERLPDGGVLLHLSSEHRLSTTFNAYAGLWTDFIMRDTQQYILEIIRRRCERDGAGGTSEAGETK